LELLLEQQQLEQQQPQQHEFWLGMELALA